MSYNQFDPDLFDEHFSDGRPLDNEIDDSPRMLTDPYYELPVSSEIVGAEQDAILSTVVKARDNRRPCPPMQAVDLDAPLPADELGEAVGKSPGGPYALTLSLIDSWRAAGTPRIVRMDTEGDHAAFKALSSPERTEVLRRLQAVEDRLAAHIADPEAHGPGEAEQIEEDLVGTAELNAAVEAQKSIPLRMPRQFDGLLEAWHEGDRAASTMILPHETGDRWFPTASESLKKGELEAARAAAEAGVPASLIVGYLPAIGASLAGADAMKALASGAESLLQRPEARGRQSFMVRLDPQVSPTIFALGELACLCQQGHPQACKEWNALAAAAPAIVKQAMGEVAAALRPRAPQGTAAVIGGAVSDFFGGLWHKIRGFFGGGEHAPAASALPAAPAPKALPAFRPLPADVLHTLRSDPSVPDDMR